MTDTTFTPSSLAPAVVRPAAEAAPVVLFPPRWTAGAAALTYPNERRDTMSDSTTKINPRGYHAETPDDLMAWADSLTAHWRETPAPDTTTPTRHEPNPLHRGCPECGFYDGSLYIGKGEWAYCLTHRTKWMDGANVTSGWREQTEDGQRAEYDRLGLGDFRHIERIRYGQEPTLPNLTPPEHCPDCGVGHGEYHWRHCDIECCPQCGGQLISHLDGCTETAQP
jgi:hypothetical protein